MSILSRRGFLGWVGAAAAALCGLGTKTAEAAADDEYVEVWDMYLNNPEGTILAERPLEDGNAEIVRVIRGAFKKCEFKVPDA